MTAQPLLEQQFAASWPPRAWAEVHVVVAVSGGADSVATLRAMHALRQESDGELIVAHVDHGLRQESAADAQFVAQLAESLGCRSIVRSVETQQRAAQAGDGLEAAARELRYEALLEIAHGAGARYLVAGHTADDQAETVLHRILRGTSVAGLAGIPRTRPLSDSVTLIRPLLGLRRREVEAYLAELGQPYRTDATNLAATFTRNRIRHELLPRLAADFNPAVAEALLRLSDSAAEAQQALEEWAARLSVAAVIGSTSDRIEIDCGPLGEAPLHVRSLVLTSQWSRQGWPQQAMSREHWLRLAQMTLAEQEPAGPSDFPGGVVVEKKEAGQLVLTRL